MKHSPLFLLIPAILVACTANSGPDTDGASSSSSMSSQSSLTASDLPAGDFTEDEDNTRGTAYVRGYVEVRQVPEPMCETNCTMYDAVLFRVTETPSEGLLQYMALMGQDLNSQNSFIGLGCKEGNVIKYENQVGMDMRAVTLSADVSSTILNSTERNQVILKLTKEPIGGGRGAPACYSHFTTVGVVEGQTSSEDSAMLTYLGSTDGYAMQYPEGWTVTQKTRIPWLSRESSATKFAAPADIAEGTALMDAAVYAEKTAAPCPEFPNPMTETHNGYTFTKGEMSDAGAGNLNETTMLTTKDGNSCYTLTLHTHSCNLGADCGADHAKPFDRSALEAIFAGMADSFRLL